jgi:hypothetical protein
LDKIPYKGNTGICVSPIRSLNCLADLEMVKAKGEHIIGHVGIEWITPVSQFITKDSQLLDFRLRIGMISQYDQSQLKRINELTFGGGIEIFLNEFSVNLQYAYANQDFCPKQIVSCKISLSK